MFEIFDERSLNYMEYENLEIVNIIKSKSSVYKYMQAWMFDFVSEFILLQIAKLVHFAISISWSINIARLLLI